MKNGSKNEKLTRSEVKDLAKKLLFDGVIEKFVDMQCEEDDQPWRMGRLTEEEKAEVRTEAKKQLTRIQEFLGAYEVNQRVEAREKNNQSRWRI